MKHFIHRGWLSVLGASLSIQFAFGVEADCRSLVAKVSSKANFEALTEKHSIRELIDPNPATNLAVLHPSVIMHAFQRINSWVRSIPPYQTSQAHFDGAETATIYPIFSQRSDYNNRRKIVGNFDQIAVFADHMQAGAQGDGSRSKLLLFAGPSGTGKSEFIDIVKAVGINLSTTQPEYFLYTFEWKDLHKIPALRSMPYLDIQKTAAGEETSNHVRADLEESPFILLPVDMQDRIVKMAHDPAMKLANADPRPDRTPASAQTRKILAAIYEHYSAEAKKEGLSDEEVVDALEKHVVIRRRVLDSSNFPKLVAQGKDVPYHQLFFTENPFVISTNGPSDPFAYHNTGTVLRGHGIILGLDEWFRNPPPLRDTFLNVIESGEVQRGGAPTIRFDGAMIGASNDESIRSAMSDSDARAHLDRIRSVPMRLSTDPVEVAETLLHMKGERILKMRRLGANAEDPNAAAAWEPMNLEEVFPLPGKPNYGVGPDGRVVIAVKTSASTDDVFISPHTIMYMALTIAATRLNTSVEDAMKTQGKYPIIAEPVFSDPITRIKAILGEIDINGAERDELRELALLLKQGENGISNRDAANAWLTQAIATARLPENANTLTPEVARMTFLHLLEEGGITVPDHVTRLKWMSLLDRVGRELITPRIESDLLMAISSDESTADNLYNEVKAEILALSRDRTATTYVASAGRQTRPINMARLAEIQAIYKRDTNRPLEFNQVLNFHASSGSDSGKKFAPLHKAVIRFVADKITAITSIEALADYGRTGSGMAEVQTKYLEAANVLSRRFGYNAKSMQSALDFIKQQRAEMNTGGPAR